ncbi:uncharacterized protein BDZ83DRAFT_595115, partial [Colletotrichum acutatum]
PGSGIKSYFYYKYRLKGKVFKDIKDYYSYLDLVNLKVNALPSDNSSAIK